MKQRCENHQKCMQMIQAVIDGSASEAELEHFKLHMDDCMPCIEGYKLEKSIKDALKLKMEKKCCPQSTVVDIRSKIGLGLLILMFVFAEVKLYHLLFSC